VVLRAAMNDRKVDKILPHVETTVAGKKADKAQHGTPMTGRAEISGKGESSDKQTSPRVVMAGSMLNEIVMIEMVAIGIGMMSNLRSDQQTTGSLVLDVMIES
jgi:hypothetical protein